MPRILITISIVTWHCAVSVIVSSNNVRVSFIIYNIDNIIDMHKIY